MQFRNLFVSLFGTKAKAAVLQTLVQSPAKTWTGRELARAAGVSVPQAGQALTEFERQGLIWRKMAGRSALWSLNREHILIDLLRPLADISSRKTQLLLDEIKSALDLRALRMIRLFGSMARGQESTSSDVDLLFIVKNPKEKEKLEEKSKDVEIRLAEHWGNVGAILVYDQQEYESKRGLSLMRNIEREGITLYEETRHA